MIDIRTAPGVEPPSRERWLNRTVLGAGVTSALGDFSYETPNAILPGFLAVLGITPAALGAIEGDADAACCFTKLGAGYIAGGLGARKALVDTGYALTTLVQALMAIARGWPLSGARIIIELPVGARPVAEPSRQLPTSMPTLPS